MSAPDADPAGDAPIPLPITDELDLHTFRPEEIEALLGDYVEACTAHGLRTVRIIHGKGTGALRERVHRWLRHSPRVESFALCDAASGGWGATRATLRARTS
jgi:DNA-nicking Smr family endonuclease